MVTKTLRVTLFNGRNLSAADLNGKSDPYCVFKLGETQQKSKVKKSTLNPNWNEDIDFPINFPQEHLLELTVFDKDLIGKNDVLGAAKIDLSGLQFGVQQIVLARLVGGVNGENLSNIIEQKIDHSLEDQGGIAKLASHLIDSEQQNYGVITLGVTLLHDSSDNVPLLVQAIPGHVVVRLFGAAHLRGTDVNGKADPFVELKIGEHKLKSKKKKGNLNPNWDGLKFEIPYSNPNENLEVAVKDYDLIGHSDVIGTVTIPIAALSRNVENITTFRLEGGEHGENLAHKAEELKADIAGDVASHVAGKKAGSFINKLAGSSEFKGNPGVICLGLTY